MPSNATAPITKDEIINALEQAGVVVSPNLDYIAGLLAERFAASNLSLEAQENMVHIVALTERRKQDAELPLPPPPPPQSDQFGHQTAQVEGQEAYGENGPMNPND